MRKARLLGVTALLTLITAPAFAGITYGLRDARFFGGDTATRETTDGGTFDASLSDQLAVNYSTGGGTPTTFDALSSSRALPFGLGASNHVSATANTALTFNSDFTTPTNIVSLVQSSVNETNVTVTGGTGTAYLLPSFRIQGTLDDSHSSAFSQIAMCVGVNGCIPLNVATSLSGSTTVDTIFTPGIDSGTDFTFGSAFTFFFFVSAGISSFTNGNLAAGELGAEITGVTFLGFSVVDANGDPIPGAVVHSEFADLIAAPEPAPLALLGLGLAALIARRRRG